MISRINMISRKNIYTVYIVKLADMPIFIKSFWPIDNAYKDNMFEIIIHNQE